MNADLDRQLCGRYANLYRDRHADMRVTAMCWGFACGDGWYDLIDRLSARLEALILALPTEEQRSRVCASQVKEKYGTLCIYMTSETAEMSNLIHEAEEQSGKTCEECGTPGVLRQRGGWYFTACNAHSRGRPPLAEEQPTAEVTVVIKPSDDGDAGSRSA